MLHQIHIDIPKPAWDQLLAGTKEWPQPVTMNQIGRYAVSELAAEFWAEGFDPKECTPIPRVPPARGRHLQIRTQDRAEAADWDRLAQAFATPRSEVLRIALGRLLFHIG